MSIDPQKSDQDPEDPNTESLPSFDPPTPLPKIDGYDIIREVARAGQGMVYQAIQKSTNQIVAVKTLRNDRPLPKAIREELEKAFKLEIELIAQLKHPNIISIHDAGRTTDGRSFYAMEYVNGKPLGEYVNEHKLSMLSMLRLFRTVCEAVGCAHERGVTHFDLKPSNILVDSQGTVKVLDFGLARPLLMLGTPNIADGEGLFGTLEYMSPEQTYGNRSNMDVCTDVYSLGVTLYELLTGEFPYPVRPCATSTETIEHIRKTPPTAPRKKWTAGSGIKARTASGRRPGGCPLDKDISSIVLTALAKDPGRRYRNAAEFAQAVGRYINDEPIDPVRLWDVIHKLWDVTQHRVRKALQRNWYASQAGVIVMAALLSYLLVNPLLFRWPHAVQFFFNLESAFLPAAVKEFDLDHVCIIARTDETDMGDLAREAGLEGVTLENIKSLRQLHGRLMEHLARSGCRCVAWDIGFPPPTSDVESGFDVGFVEGVRRLGEVGIDVVAAVDKWKLADEPEPALSPTIAPIVHRGCTAVHLEMELPWRVQLVVQRGQKDTLPSLTLAAYAAAQHPHHKYDIIFDPDKAVVGLLYWTPDEVNRDEKNYLVAEPDRIPLTYTQPWDDLPRPFGLLEGDVLGVFAIAIPSDKKLTAATVPYQTAFRADEEELKRLFAGKVVIVADQRSGIDWHLHPDGRNVSGCYVHAAAIEALFRRAFIQTLTWGEEFALAWIGALLGCAVAVTAVGSALRRYLVLTGLAIALVAASLLACWLFRHLLNPPLIPIVALWMSCEASAAVLRVWHTRRVSS